jgi:hypothetical protein
LTAEDWYKIEYAELGNLNRHYSTIRSALTTFLLTASLGAFGGYFLDAGHNPYFGLAGFILILCANFVCLHFSYLTEWSALYMSELWRASKDPNAAGVNAAEIQAARDLTAHGFKNFRNPRAARAHMRRDWMNYAVVALSVALAGAFFAGQSVPGAALGRAAAFTLIVIGIVGLVAMFFALEKPRGDHRVGYAFAGGVVGLAVLGSWLMWG